MIDNKRFDSASYEPCHGNYMLDNLMSDDVSIYDRSRGKNGYTNKVLDKWIVSSALITNNIILNMMSK